MIAKFGMERKQLLTNFLLLLIGLVLVDLGEQLGLTIPSFGVKPWGPYSIRLIGTLHKETVRLAENGSTSLELNQSMSHGLKIARSVNLIILYLPNRSSFQNHSIQ